MKLTVALTILASATFALCATVTGFAGADCTGAQVTSGSGGVGTCLTLVSASAKSFSYSGVPSQIRFFVSGGAHNSCTNGAQLSRSGGSGCATAPAGFNWQSVDIH